MTENLYTQYANKYYNPNDDGKKPGDNENWESIQKGFSRIGSTQLETTEGLTLGKGTEDETIVTAAELKEMKQGVGNPVVISLFYTAEGFETNVPYKMVYENAASVVNGGLPIFEFQAEGQSNYPGTTRTLGYINIFDTPETIPGVRVYESNVEYSSAPATTTEIIIATCHEPETGNSFFITENGKVALMA